MQSKAYTVFVLGTDSKSFAIYTSPEVGQNIQMKLTENSPNRPKTHKLLETEKITRKGDDLSINKLVDVVVCKKSLTGSELLPTLTL